MGSFYYALFFAFFLTVYAYFFHFALKIFQYDNLLKKTQSIKEEYSGGGFINKLYKIFKKYCNLNYKVI